jgi:hypothetical protein
MQLASSGSATAVDTARIDAVEPPVATELVRPRQRALRRWSGLVAPVLFVLVVWARFLGFEFDNDHFRMIVQGRQLLRFGELPYRDFVDPGIFLQIWTSAALQQLFGDNLVGQAFFDLAILGLAAAVTYTLAAGAAGSARVGLLTTVLAVALQPRLKQHQVVFLPVLGLLLCWRYLDRPSLPRLAALSLGGALAFLIRHDHGVYLAAPVLVTLVAAHRRDGWRVLLGRGALCGAMAAVVLAPFFVFLEANGGLVGYFRSASEYIRAEASRQGALQLHDFTIDASAPWLVLEPAPPGPPGRVQVRWQTGVSPEQRAQLERQYQLANPRRLDRSGSPIWRYDAFDHSPGNLRALVRDGHVERTFRIDRENYRLEQEPTEPFVISWWRAFPLLGLRLAPGILHGENAIPWLYYLFFALPVLVLLVLLSRRLSARASAGRLPHETWNVLPATLLCLAMLPSLRDPLADRLADVAALPAILGAWLLGRSLRVSSTRASPRQSRPSIRRPDRGLIRSATWATAQRSICTVLAMTLLALTSLSVASVPAVGQQFQRLMTQLSDPEETGERVREVLDTIQAPGVRSRTGISSDLLTLAGYVQACTRASDRLLVTWFAPEMYFYAKRGFAGRQIFWFPRFYSSPEDQERILASLQAHPTPVAIHRTDRADSVGGFERVQAYLVERYQVVHQVARDEGPASAYQVLVDSQREPTGRYDRLALPCYA